MTRDEFAALVDRLRESRPVWFDLESDAPASEDDLAAVEAELGGRLPEHVRWFLARYGGGDFGLGVVYSADPRSHVRLPDMQDGMPGGLVAVADNGAGDRYAVGAGDDVFVLDHETDSVEATEDAGFLDLVRRIALGDER